MPIEQRAKIFLPFAGVRGLDEALEHKRQERLMEERIILSEDGEKEVDSVLSDIHEGDTISVSYYCSDRYRNTAGTVIRKDEKERCILLEDGPVYFSDIHTIEKK